MSATILKILKVILALLLLAAVVALVFWLTQRQGWPWWLGAALLAGLLGLWFGVLALRKYFLRRREREFVRRVVEQDEAAIQGSPAHEREQLKELQEHWHRSIELLRNSHLRKRGNPLYVLPWYLVIGESGFGKTSAIKNAFLESPLNEESRSAAISATRNCDWWFFDDAIILDTAGRYTIPIEEGKDREEWERFLSLLARYRRREPVNGIVVVMTSNCLLEADRVKLREHGQRIRQRVDQIMRGLGARVPIYLLVTKMDLVPGMVDFCSHLPGDGSRQIMGYVNARSNPYYQEVISEACNAVSAQLRRLRQIILKLPGRPRPLALAFPVEFDRLRPGLHSIVKAVFEENPYQETPLLRGVFFSSAIQTQSWVASDFTQICGLEGESGSLPSGGTGLFLSEFFEKLLPGDRHLFTPLLEFLRWRRLTQNLGLVSWTLVWLCLWGLLSLSFIKNTQAIGSIQKDFLDPASLTNDLATNFRVLDMMRLELATLRNANRDWWVPRFGLHQSSEMEERLLAHYFQLFRGRCLNPIDARFAQQLARIGPDTPEESMVDYAGYLATRILLIRQYLRQEPPTVLEDFRRATTALLAQQYPEVPAAISSSFADLYQANLYWSRDRWEREGKIEELQTLLARLLDRKGKDLHWLVLKWIPNAGPVRMQDFWGEFESAAPDDSVIAGAYTRSGRRNIESFLRLIDEALAGSYNLDQEKRDFWRWYQEQAYNAWYQFAGSFPSGSRRMISQRQWQRLAASMTTNQNPYFQFLQRMGQELSMFPDARAGSWDALALELNRVQEAARALQQKDTQNTLIGKLQEQGKKAITEARGKIDPESTRRLEREIREAQMWNTYTQALAQLTPVITSRDTCFKEVSQFFPDSAAANASGAGGPDGQSGFRKAYDDFFHLANLLQPEAEYPFMIDLIRGPLDFLMDYSIKETSTVLNEQWQEQVLGRLYGADEDRIPQLLFAKSDGLIWKFLAGTARPFVADDRNGLMAREVSSWKIPFKDDFFAFVNAAQEGVVNYEPEYKVMLETLPLDINDGAEMKPYANSVCLQCSDSRQCLENFNYPKSLEFQYNPDKCGDVALKISLPDLELKREYPGRLGLANFLADFAYGTHTYRAADFPDATERLKQRGIQWIRVSYKITGGAPVLRWLKRPLSRVPTEIVSTWVAAAGRDSEKPAPSGGRRPLGESR